MAILSNINGKFAVDSTGAIQFSGSAGTSGYILRSNGNAAPTWVDSSTVIGGPYLPLAGGTLTGATATATGISFTVGGNLFVTGTSTLTGALSGSTGTFTGNLKLIAGASTTYFSEKGYLGDSFNFGTGETTDGVSYTINGAQAGTAGNYFRWLTQTGAATPTEKVRITDYGSLVVGNTPGTNVNWGKIQCGGTITVGNSSGTYNAHGRIYGDSTSGLRLIGTKSGTYTGTMGITIASYNVGINTIAPAATLHVDANGGGVLRISRLSASTTNYMQFENDGTNGTIRTEGATIFRAGGSTERMRIDSSGRTIIQSGTFTTPAYTPAQGYPLHVQGISGQSYISIGRSGQTTGNQGMIVGIDTTSSYLWNRDNVNMTFGTNDLTRIVVSAAGNVYFAEDIGVGTSVTTGGFNVNNSTAGSYYNMSNSDSGNYKYTNPGGRLLTSNATGWFADGRDPILTLSSSGNSENSAIGNSIGLNLYTNSFTYNNFSPLITFSALSDSGSYASAYAAIAGRKTNRGPDTNWNTGDLCFWVTGPPASNPASYMQQTPTMTIKSGGNVLKPKSCAFSASTSVPGFTVGTTEVKIAYNTENVDTNGNYDTTNYRFTAPVTGNYLIGTTNTCYISTGVTVYMAIYIRKNGVGTSYRFRGGGVDNDVNDWFGMNGSVVIPLAQGDYIELWGYANSGSFQIVNTEGHFYGYLIG